MAIHYYTGDLLKTDLEIIAHGCNAQGVMGAGIAALIKRRWPEAVKPYFDASRTRELRLGEVIEGRTSEGLIVLNAITQINTGNDRRYVSYDAVDIAMRKCADKAASYSRRLVGIPRIGAGLAGGDWAIIEKIIERVSDETGVDFMVYSLEN